MVHGAGGPFDLAFAAQALRRHLEHPGKHQRRHEAKSQQHHQRLQHPVGGLEYWQQGFRYLHQQPGADEVKPGHADDVAAAEFGKKTARLVLGHWSHSKDWSAVARHPLGKPWACQ